jgi:hypothetical protein
MKIHYFVTVLILFSVLHVTCQINPSAEQKEEVNIQSRFSKWIYSERKHGI